MLLLFRCSNKSLVQEFPQDASKISKTQDVKTPQNIKHPQASKPAQPIDSHVCLKNVHQNISSTASVSTFSSLFYFFFLSSPVFLRFLQLLSDFSLFDYFLYIYYDMLRTM